MTLCPICLEKIGEKKIDKLECGHKIHSKCLSNLIHSNNDNMTIMFLKDGKPFYTKDQSGMVLNKNDCSIKCCICRAEYSCMCDENFKKCKQLSKIKHKVVITIHGEMWYHHITNVNDIAHYLTMKDWIRCRIHKIDEISKKAFALFTLFHNYSQYDEVLHVIKCPCKDINCPTIMPVPVSLCPACKGEGTHATGNDIIENCKNNE